MNNRCLREMIIIFAGDTLVCAYGSVQTYGFSEKRRNSGTVSCVRIKFENNAIHLDTQMMQLSFLFEDDDDEP